MSHFGKVMRIASARLPTVIGEAYGGGFYVGRMTNATLKYILIVSPAAYETTLEYCDGFNSTDSKDSFDGAANTAAMVAANDGFKAAEYCAGLSIGGFTDWFLPSRFQLELCYRNLKPRTTNNSTSGGLNINVTPTTTAYTATNPTQTTAAAFQFNTSTQVAGPESFTSPGNSLGFYWSSTQVNFSTGYVQSMYDGQSKSDSKTTAYRVRAVRMIQILE